MDSHIAGIAERASLHAEPAPPVGLADVLGRYAAELGGQPASRTRAQRGKGRGGRKATVR
jgi:hypothetical protein